MPVGRRILPLGPPGPARRAGHRLAEQHRHEPRARQRRPSSRPATSSPSASSNSVRVTRRSQRGAAPGRFAERWANGALL